MSGQRLNNQFFKGEVIEIARQLPGKLLVRRFDDGRVLRYRITDTEAYRGEDDLACHASRGRTARTEVMYHRGGKVYVYLIYGMYWLLNFVTSDENYPAAVLIRGIEGIKGPGRVGKALQLDLSFYGEELSVSNRIWVEDDGFEPVITAQPRIGVDYAGEWALMKWRFVIWNRTLIVE